ncbi:MAG: hypothetical protein ACRD9Q_10455 [Nitrososphaeraceae archaeon]
MNKKQAQALIKYFYELRIKFDKLIKEDNYVEAEIILREVQILLPGLEKNYKLKTDFHAQVKPYNQHFS